MRELYIFDLDGTLALIDHRRPLLEEKGWDEFYRACVDDKPNLPILKIFNCIDRASNLFSHIRIWSGRSDLVRQETIDWLYRHTIMRKEHIEKILKMRRHGDYTPDEILKKQWYDELSNDERSALVAVFDDRQKMVDMWHSIGVTCLQVAKGDF